MFEKFRIKITILASLIITAYCFFSNISFLRTCYSIIATIIVFYFFGTIAELKIKSYIEKKSQEEIEESLEQNNDLKDEINLDNSENEENQLDDNIILDEDKDFYDINFEEE